MAKAEEIAYQNGYPIGTRNYYRKLGYKLEDTYMVKELQFTRYSLRMLILICIVFGFLISLLLRRV